jgi:phosphonate transport system substrate-binding protein
LLFVVLAFIGSCSSAQAQEILRFGVINQRSIQLTARYWNPILKYVGEKTGEKIRLSMGKTAPQTTAMTVKGRHDLVYTNHLFTRARDKLGFRVILRIQGQDIHSALIVSASSRIKSVRQLQGKRVAFPSREAFVGYWVPMDYLVRSGISVRPLYAGNQEGAMSQLRNGRVVAAAVNKSVLERFARRTGLRYRVIWQSAPYRNIPIMVRPGIDADRVRRIRKAFIGMSKDPAGRRILAASAALIRQQGILVFVRADDREYENYRRFYRETVLKKH